MAQNFNVYLKLDWDIPPRCPDTKENKVGLKGHFVGRRREIDRLVNDLLRRNQGAFLISGQRGVGKTSLVYKALHELTNKDNKYIFVLLNASQLEISEEINPPDSSSEEKIPARRILDNLIRRFYTATENYKSILGKEISSDVETLFKKAIATKCGLTEIKINKQTKLTENEEIAVIKRSLLLDQENLKKIVALTCFLFAGAFQFNGIPFLSNFWQKIIPLLLAFPLPFIVVAEYSKSQLEKVRDEEEKTAKEYYDIDANIGNLEYDLEQIHKKIVAKDYKIVYVIDELDKLKPEPVKKVLKFFKSLFTLSSAVFIFIGDKELFIKINEAKNSKDLEYTYFSQKYFLQRPEFKDLEDFIDQIISKPDKKEIQKNRLYRDFRNYAIYLAKSDFFELYDVIRDSIRNFDTDMSPIIELKELIGEELIKSRLQKCIGLVYSKYAFESPSKWFNNEELLRGLYAYTDELITYSINKQFQDDKGGGDLASAKRFLNTLLYRIGAISFVSSTQENINGRDIPIVTYLWLGKNDFNVPSNSDVKSEIEQRFIDKIKTLLEKSFEIANCNSQLRSVNSFTKQQLDSDPRAILEVVNQMSGVDVLSQFNNNEKEYKNLLSNKPPYTIRREEIEKRTQQFDSTISSLRNNSINIFINFLKFKISNIYSCQLQQRTDLFSHFQVLRNGVISKISHQVILKSQNDTSKQLLLTVNIPSNLVTESEKILKDNNKSFKVLNFQTDTQVTYKDIDDAFWNIKIEGFKSFEDLVIKIVEWFNS